jgi:hypothetical protein
VAVAEGVPFLLLAEERFRISEQEPIERVVFVVVWLPSLQYGRVNG